MAKKTQLAERLETVREKIEAACAKAGRSAGEVTLIAVTKTAAPEQVREILTLGVGDLGESRVQVLQPRAATVNEFYQRRQQSGDGSVPARLRWHMIGHLQRNKVKAVLSIVDLIHSIDSLRLAEEIDIVAAKMGRKVPVMLQINASEEKSKYGVAVGASVHLAEQIDSMPNLQLIGLMAMAPLTGNPDEARFVFSRTREIFDEMKWHKLGGQFFRHLSMGMSNDYEQAILEGATMIRLGTVLFGGKLEGDHDPDDAVDLDAQLRRKANEPGADDEDDGADSEA